MVEGLKTNFLNSNIRNTCIAFTSRDVAQPGCDGKRLIRSTFVLFFAIIASVGTLEFHFFMPYQQVMGVLAWKESNLYFNFPTFLPWLLTSKKSLFCKSLCFKAWRKLMKQNITKQNIQTALEIKWCIVSCRGHEETIALTVNLMLSLSIIRCQGFITIYEFYFW